MSHLVAVVVRLLVLGAFLAAYYAAQPLIFPGEQDANIGAGLIGFAVVAAVSGLWGILDGRSDRAASATVTWALVAAVFGLLWLIGLATLEYDDSLTLAERLQTDAFLTVFMGGLVLVPALAGVAIGRSFGNDR